MFKRAITFLSGHFVLVISLLVALMVYSRFIYFGHISWDDPEMVFKNTDVKDFDITLLLSRHYVGNYIPLTMLAHALNWFLFGASDAGHHVVNILIHLFNGVLVYMIGRRLFGNALISNLATIVFLLHPLQIESVAWIAELKNVLSGSFYLVSLLFYLRYISGFKRKDLVFCFVFFVLGCLSKSSVVVLPLSLICFDIFLNKKISWRFLWHKIPFLMVAFVFGFINIRTQTADLFINHAHEFPYYQRLGYAGFALVKYVILFLLPINLSVIYPYPPNPTAAMVVGYMILGVTGFLIFFTYKKQKFGALAIALFTLVNLILVLQFIPFGEVLYADRYMYLPVIGFTWFLAMVLVRVKARLMPSVIISLCLLAFLSFFRSNVWRSGVTLYEDILRNYPNSFVALNSVGVEYMFRNEDEKALYYFNKATTIAPRNYKGFYNRGLLYLKNRKPEAAIGSFNQTLAIYDYPKAYVGRASAYHMLGDIPKAINDANYILRTNKDNAKAHFVLGNCYNDLNKLDEAFAEYNRCIELNKDEADYYFKRGIIYGKKQDFRSCLNDLKLAISLNSTFYEAYYWMGVAKVNLKENGCADFRLAAQHNFQPAITALQKHCGTGY